MNAMASLGVILLFALLMGHLFKYLRLPEVTGYIFAGVLVGPGVLGWVNEENLSGLAVFSEVALGLILFSIGTVFDLRRLRESGPRLLKLVLIEAGGTALLVWFAMMVLGQPWRFSLILGITAMETAAATTMMVLREVNSTGPLTDTLISYIGINNVLTLLVFSVAVNAFSPAPQGSAGLAAFHAVYPVLWQLFGSLALGYLVGLLLSSWAVKVIEHGETLILLIGCVLLAVGTAILLDLSPLVTSLAVGATMANLSGQTIRTISVLTRTDPPFYAVFFVIAGADLNFGVLKTVGILAPAYVIARLISKLGVSRLAARRLGMPAEIQNTLGLTLLCQAGLAVGLTTVLRRTFPQTGAAISAVILAAVVIHEVIGPISTRFGLLRSGEAMPESAEALTLLE